MAKYSKDFYSDLAITSDLSAKILTPILIKRYSPASVVDFGCGSGSFIKAFKAQGVSDVLGIEGEWVLQVNSMISEKWLRIEDLRFPVHLEKKYDLAICLEVAEHLPPEASRTLIETLVNSADRIAFSAAIPGQAGTDHINLQYPVFWAELFREHNYFLEWDPRDEIWDIKKLAPWYKQNLLIFQKSSYERSLSPIPEIRFHPDIFIEYMSTSSKLRYFLKRLFRKLFRMLFSRK